MIDIRDEDIVLRRDGRDGRFVLFTKTDLPPKHPLPWFGVVLDTGDDGHGILVGLDPDPAVDAWAACDLLHVAVERARAEVDRRLGPLASEVRRQLELALAAEHRRLGHSPNGRVKLAPGPAPSPYPWTVAVRAGHELPLCPDPEAREAGITPEQLLIVLDQLFADAAATRTQRPYLNRARAAVQAAMAADAKLVARLRQFGG